MIQDTKRTWTDRTQPFRPFGEPDDDSEYEELDDEWRSVRDLDARLERLDRYGSNLTTAAGLLLVGLLLFYGFMIMDFVFEIVVAGLTAFAGLK